jgi:hypothetical protein
MPGLGWILAASSCSKDRGARTSEHPLDGATVRTKATRHSEVADTQTGHNSSSDACVKRITTSTPPCFLLAARQLFFDASHTR